MATQYPSKLDNSITLPEVTDLTTIYSAEVYNRLRNAIIAIETELGVKPASVYTTVENRFNLIEGNISNLQIITLANDLGGTLSLPKVIGIQGKPISSTEPSINQGLVFNGTSWAPANLASGTLAFTATGDLDGTELTQTVVGLQGRALANSAPEDGYVIIWDAGGTTWKPGLVNSFTAAGDLSGSNTSQTVIRLQSIPVDATAPTDGYLLTYDAIGGYWHPAPAPVGFSAGGDLTGTATSQQVISLTGSGGVIAIPTAALAFGASPALTGDIRLMASATNKQIVFRNEFDSADLCAIHATGTGLNIGSDSNQASPFTTIGIYPASMIYMGINSTTHAAVNSNGFMVYGLSDSLTMGYAGTSTTGTIRFKNTDSIKSLNFAGDTDYILAGTDVSDNLFLGGNVDGSNAHAQVFISPGSFGYLRAGGTTAALWNSTNFMPSTPVIGYNAVYGVHGGIIYAFISDANYTVDTAVYQYDWNEYTTGAWTSGHSIIYPDPVSKDKGYYKTIFNNTSYTITVSTGTGATQTVLAGSTRRFWFDNSGVSIAGLINGIEINNIVAGTDGYVLSTVFGVPIWTIQTPRQYNITFAAGVQTTTSASFTRAGARLFDMTPYPATIGALTRTVTFVADVDKTSGATNVEVQLYDTTHAVVVTGTNLTSTSNSNAAISATLTVGASSGNLRDDAASQYELQFKMNGGGGPDAVFLTNARLVITYS